MDKNNSNTPGNKLFDPLSGNKTLWIAASLVAFVTCVVYLPALQNGFVNWDDQVYVYENRNIQLIDIELLKWSFTAEANPTWHPLTIFSLALDYAFWGPNPIGYHLTNIILHTFNTFLVFIIVIYLIKCFTITNTTSPFPLFKKRWGSVHYNMIAGVVTALLFGIHPLHVESVAWISERKDVLCTFFYLLSLLMYLIYTSISSRGAVYYYISLTLFSLALMSKPMAVSLPIVLLIIDFYPLKRLTTEEGLYKKILIEKLPFFVLSFLTSLIAVWAQHSGEALPSLEEVSPVDRIFIAICAYVFYLAKMILPFNLAPFYPYIKTAYFTYEYMGSLILLVAITLFVLFKKNKLYSVLWLYYIVTLLAVIGIVKVGDFAAADRYTYLPSLGPFLLLGLGIGNLFERCSKKQKMVLAAALILTFGVLISKTITQIPIWKDSITLWSYEVKIFPNVELSYYNRGKAYDALGAYREAIRDFSKVIELNPRYVRAYNNRGVIYGKTGNYQQALMDFTQVIKTDPQYTDGYYNRGFTYTKVNNYQQAIMDFDIAIKLNPKSIDAYYNRGTVYRILGDNYKAINDFSMAIKVNPQDAEAYNNRGNAYRDLGNYQQAIEGYSMAIKLNPKDTIAYRNRGVAYQKMGKPELASEDFSRADELKLR